MKAAAPEVPIIMVSGADVPEQYIAMCDGYVRKADGPERLLRVVRELLSADSQPGAVGARKAS